MARRFITSWLFFSFGAALRCVPGSVLRCITAQGEKGKKKKGKRKKGKGKKEKGIKKESPGISPRALH